MAAFEPILSGIPGLDSCLDSIRLGDNVVWQVSDLDAFRYFARAFAEQAVRDGRNILYIRFAGHDPILPAMPGVREIHVPLSHLFESFTVDIHNLIEREGRDAFYVFDCLSELEEAWATDLMMGNFFHLTCPFLDSWERFFHAARVKYDAGLDIQSECDRMCDIMLTRDKRMRGMIVEQFQPEDYFEIHDRMIGTGLIGGKACGMLLSRKIVQNRDAELFERIEPHDSFYIGSDVFRESYRPQHRISRSR